MRFGGNGTNRITAIRQQGLVRERWLFVNEHGHLLHATDDGLQSGLEAVFREHGEVRVSIWGMSHENLHRIMEEIGRN
jgi:hypothetical protein